MNPNKTNTRTTKGSVLHIFKAFFPKFVIKCLASFSSWVADSWISSIIGFAVGISVAFYVGPKRMDECGVAVEII